MRAPIQTSPIVSLGELRQDSARPSLVKKFRLTTAFCPWVVLASGIDWQVCDYATVQLSDCANVQSPNTGGPTPRPSADERQCIAWRVAGDYRAGTCSRRESYATSGHES